MSKYNKIAIELENTFNDKYRPKDSIFGCARRLSEETNLTWYVLTHAKRDSITCVKEDLSRFVKQGFKVECCFDHGKRYSPWANIPRWEPTLADLLRVAEQET